MVPGFVDDAEAALAYDSGDFEFGQAAAYGEEAGFVGCGCWAGDGDARSRGETTAGDDCGACVSFAGGWHGP
ncbi:hypothetical protein VHAB30_46110 [Variovorax boronicumulans]|nr:hypothetical protein VHAB30_46110 [Variovorax boronicumulans]